MTNKTHLNDDTGLCWALRRTLASRPSSRQDFLIPFIEFSHQSLKDLGILLTKICLLTLIERQIEQAANLAIPEEFPFPLSHRVLIIDPPKESAITHWARAFDHGQ